MNENIIENSIAYCGLVCSLCHVSDYCSGCRSESNSCGRHLSEGGCYQRSCCIERGFSGCWECLESEVCRKDMFSESHDIRLRAFVDFIKEEGKGSLAYCLARNTEKGIIYGYNRDYDGLGSAEAVLHLLRTGERVKCSEKNEDGENNEF